MGYIRNSYADGCGYVYQKGIDEIKNLGETVYKKYENEINDMITCVNEKKISQRALREAQYAAEKIARKTEEEKYSRLVISAEDGGFYGRPQAGDIEIKNGHVYKVISSYYNKYDGWSFGAMSEKWYDVTCIDITDTDKGAEILKKKADKDAEAKAACEAAQAEKARIDALKEVVKTNGECVMRTEDGQMTYMPDGEILYDTFDIYGKGDKIIKTDTEMWLVVNNGMDGDDWSCNTIRTGGAGAYGWKAPLSAIEEKENK